MSTPITLKTLGPGQRVLLLKAKEGAVTARSAGEQDSLMRLHGHGLLERGRAVNTWWLTLKGEAVVNGVANAA